MESIKLKVNKFISSKFYKFLVVGAFCTLQNIFWLYLLTTILKLHYILSIIILMITVNTLGFYLNRCYTFRKHENNNFLYELGKYHSVMLSNFFSVLILMYILVDIFKIWYLYANIIITIGMTLWNFFMHKKWTFK